MPIESEKKIRDILTTARTIAVVGASCKPWRDSHRIAGYLKRHGYTIFYVNPTYSEIEGDKCYPDLKSIDKPIDIVDVFRNPDAVNEIVDEAIAVNAKTVWFQIGIINETAAQKAETAGIQVVMDHCIAIDHTSLIQ
jgi:predicted CoA-binding protein